MLASPSFLYDPNCLPHETSILAGPALSAGLAYCYLMSFVGRGKEIATFAHDAV